MSIEALPNELLVKIFTYLENQVKRGEVVYSHPSSMGQLTTIMDLLWNLSLVNRRWNQVIGQRATLNMSKTRLKLPEMNDTDSDTDTEPELKGYEDICIPLEVLCGSSREYIKFSCSMRSMDLLMMSGTFGAVLEYCHQRWNMNALHIISGYDQFILFLQQHKHILNDVVRADISVYNSNPWERCFDRRDPLDTHFVLPMVKLQQLNLWYSASFFCSLSFHAPMLEILEVRQAVRNKVDLIFPESSKLRSVCFNGVRSLPRYPANEGQRPKTTRLEFMDYSIVTTLSTMFGNLQTVRLSDVTINPTDDALECMNLTKLAFLDVKLQKPLKLRVPQLHILQCDIQALQLLHLHDAFKADVLDIILKESFIYNPQNVPVGLSSFRRLRLDLGVDTSICWLWPYLSGITVLQICPRSFDQTIHGLRNMWKHFPQLNSLGVLGMEVPDNFNFLPINVQNVSIENCKTIESCIEFPSSVECVRVENLWKWIDTISSSRMILLPPNRYSPLELVREEVVPGMVPIPRMFYSTKDCHDMENFNPPRSNRMDNVCVMVYTR